MLIVIELFFGVNQARDGYRFKKEIHGRVYTLTGVAPEPMFFMGSLALPSPPCDKIIRRSAFALSRVCF